LIVSYIYADGRKDGRDVVWYTGTYKDGKFDPENKGLLDEGKDYYAPQSFEVEGERISAGWNCHRLGQHIAQPGSANGSLSLPRKLAVKNGKLYSQVIPQIQELFTEKAENGPYFLSMRKNKGKYSSFSGWITGRKGKSVYW
jgi:sucrose-6-phosphate hydrolase SacC (GH32 family)